MEHISTSKSIPEIGRSSKGSSKRRLFSAKNSAMNTSLLNKVNQSSSEAQQMFDSSSQRSLHNFKFEVSGGKGEAVSQRNNAGAGEAPVYLVSVNSKNQLSYTLLLKSAQNLDADYEFETEFVHSFTENISTAVHIGSGDFVLFCGYPNVFFWNVPSKALMRKVALSVPNEPWFTIWDALYIRSKKTLVFGLNNGFVVQLRFNALKQDFDAPRIFQSNEEGRGVYSLVYLASVEKILATNSSNILSEFVFEMPNKHSGKFPGSSKNIGNLREESQLTAKSRSIREISEFEQKSQGKQAKSGSGSKLKSGWARRAC